MKESLKKETKAVLTIVTLLFAVFLIFLGVASFTFAVNNLTQQWKAKDLSSEVIKAQEQSIQNDFNIYSFLGFDSKKISYKNNIYTVNNLGVNTTNEEYLIKINPYEKLGAKDKIILIPKANNLYYYLSFILFSFFITILGFFFVGKLKNSSFVIKKLICLNTLTDSEIAKITAVKIEKVTVLRKIIDKDNKPILNTYNIELAKKLLPNLDDETISKNLDLDINIVKSLRGKD